MTNTIDDSFIKHFQAEIATAYQQAGSKLKPTVRVKSGIKGESTTFQVIGTGTAATKERGATVPLMEVSHTPVECVLTDYYAGEWIDSLDELKIGHDERKAVAQAGAYALGRKTDDLIISALNKTTNTATTTASELSLDLILKAFGQLNNANVPDDNERYALLGPDQWNALLSLPEFSSCEYIGEKGPFVSGCETRRWLGINWIMHTGLPKESNAHTCYLYHKNAIGLGIGMDITTDITWHGDYAAHFVNNMMSMGACLIDEDGVIKMTISD